MHKLKMCSSFAYLKRMRCKILGHKLEFECVYEKPFSAFPCVFFSDRGDLQWDILYHKNMMH